MGLFFVGAKWKGATAYTNIKFFLWYRGQRIGYESGMSFFDETERAGPQHGLTKSGFSLSVKIGKGKGPPHTLTKRCFFDTGGRE